MTFLCFVTFTFWNSYVLKLLRLKTITFCDSTLSDIYVVWCYVLSQYWLRNDLSSPRFISPRKMTSWSTIQIRAIGQWLKTPSPCLYWYPNPLLAFSKLNPLPQSYMSFDAGVQLKVLNCRFTTTMRLPVPIAHTAIKLPDFWVKDAKMWFFQAAAQFFCGRECAK